MKFYTYVSNRGFTLVELMVTVSVIAILSVIILANMNSARETGRDTKRKSDLINLQTAIELYRKKNGSYPDAGCSVAANTFASEKSCATYIVGLAPDYISKLPKDPNLGAHEGYSYMVNSTKTVYRLLAMNTVEGETVTASSKLKSCDISTNGICTPPATVATACTVGDSRFQNSFGVWGGYADVADSLVKTETAKTLCI